MFIVSCIEGGRGGRWGRGGNRRKKKGRRKSDVVIHERRVSILARIIVLLSKLERANVFNLLERGPGMPICVGSGVFPNVLVTIVMSHSDES